METLQGLSLETKSYSNILHFILISFIIAEICCLAMVVSVFHTGICVTKCAPLVLLSASRSVLRFVCVVRVVENLALLSSFGNAYHVAGWSEFEHRIRTVVSISRIAWARLELCRVCCSLR